MYKIIFDKIALIRLNKLEHNIKERIWNKLQECKENLFRFLRPLKQIEGLSLELEIIGQ